MFKKIYRNIYISLTLLSLLLATLIIIISGIMISRLFYNTHISAANQKLKLSVSSCKNYINSVLLSTGNLAHDSTIILELNLNAGLPLTSILDNACNYALKISAITVYSQNGRIYSSSNISEIPTLEALSQNESINDFIISDGPQFVSLRKDNIAKTYNNTAYNQSSGIITCCQKIYDDRNQVAGYIFADIFPSNLYQYLDYSNDENFMGNFALIRFGSDYFSYSGNYNYKEDFFRSANENIVSKDGELLIISSRSDFFGAAVGIAVPLQPVKNIIFYLYFIFVAAAAAVLTGVHFLTRNAAKRVNGRLENLLKKMETTLTDN